MQGIFVRLSSEARSERPEVLEAYGEQIHKFVERNLTHHRITEDLAVLYERA